MQRRIDEVLGLPVFLVSQVWTGNNMYAKRAAKNNDNRYGFIIKNERVRSKINSALKM